MSQKIFLTTDQTNFLNPKAGFFIPSFIPSIPRDEIPKIARYPLEKLLFYDIPHKDGEVFHAIYGLRKIESILLNAGLDCKVYSPQVIEDYAEEAALFGVYSMDPLGIGPVTSTLQGLFGHRRYNILGDEDYYEPPYTYLLFKKLIEKLKEFDKPILVGGSGAFQFDLLPNAVEELDIDCVVIGDGEIEGVNIFKRALAGEKLPKVIHTKRLPYEVDIPTIQKPVSWGLVEISRGCDRACRFCEPCLKSFRWLPVSHILEEAKINLQNSTEVCLLSEDVFRYGTEPREWVPNWGLVNLVKEVKKLPGLKSIALSHACLAAALAAPEQIEALSAEMNLSKENYSAVQPGVETGAIHTIKEYMPYKAAPFDPEQWHDVVVDGWKLLAKNYIYPAATLVIGLDTSEEDIQETISMMKRITKYHGMFFPLFLQPLGTLRDGKRYFVDWTQMSPSAQELYMLAIKYMLTQSEKMHGHLFGNSLFARAFNHFSTIVGRAVIERLEDEGFTKGDKNILKYARVFLKNFVSYTTERIKLRGKTKDYSFGNVKGKKSDTFY